MERDTDKETKKDGKLEILPHKDILKQVSVTISFNLYKYQHLTLTLSYY